MARATLLIWLILGWPWLAHSQESAATLSGPHFDVRLGPDLEKQSFTGKGGQDSLSKGKTARLYVFFSRRNDVEPRKPLRFINAEPILAKDVQDLRLNQSILLSLSDPQVIRFPRDLKDKDLVGQHAQAVVRLNEFDPDVNNGEGNGYSNVATVDSTNNAAVSLTIDRIIPKYKFPGTDRRREFIVRSHSLSKFYGTDVFLNAAVIVPDQYDSTDKPFPVVFHIPSFGGSHHFGEPLSKQSSSGVDFLHVMLDGCCLYGHHAFVDSANCGPYQTAFIEEFLPAFEKAYRTVAERRGRFLTGHSSGGWSCLWLQIQRPQTFAGAWCYSPDPVDFSMFQNIDIYRAGENLFRDANGNRRPLNHQMDGRILIWFDELSDLERVLGRGGQLGSFEAVFGPTASDGRPAPLWDRDNGAIDTRVAAQWEKYDIHRYLKANWSRLAEQLQGRIHIHVDEHDNFFLDGAVKQLASSFAHKPNSVEVTIHPGWGHGSYMNEEFGQRVNAEMAKSFLSDSP